MISHLFGAVAVTVAVGRAGPRLLGDMLGYSHLGRSEFNLAEGVAFEPTRSLRP